MEHLHACFPSGIPPQHIWNMDEKGIQMGSGRKNSGKKYLFLKYKKHKYLIQSDITNLPPFFTFLTHMTSRALSFPHHLPTCTCHVPPNHGTYSCLHRTYVHYPICPCPCLVPYSCAEASYHIPLTRSSMTHSSPLVL